MNGAALKAIAPWLGGKRTIGPEIVRELGPHRAYWEPFCGSAAVLFAKEPSQQETVNDLHAMLVNLARVLADPGQSIELYERACKTLSSTDLYFRSAEWLESLPVEQVLDNPDAAYHYLVVSWQGRNGTSGSVRTNFAPSVRYTPGGGSSPTRWRSAVESIPAWHERLRNVHILCEDAFALIEKVSDERGVVIYADPPYVADSRARGGGSRYLHDFDDDDHARLAGLLRRFRNVRVVVSYYDHPLIRRLYDGWTVVDKARQKNLHVQNRRGAGRCQAPEVLLINGPSYAEDEAPRLF